MPGACRLEAWRILPEAPTEGYCILDQQPLVYRESHQPFGTNESTFLFAIPDNLRFTSQIQKVPALKIYEQEARPRIEGDIADRIEVIIAEEIRKGQRARIFDSDESGFTATMGHIRSVAIIACVFRVVSGYVEMVRRSDNLLRAIIEAVDLCRCKWFADRFDFRQQLIVACLNILRAVTKSLIDLDRNQLITEFSHFPGQPVAATALIFDPQQTNIGPFGQEPIQWITKHQSCIDSERLRIWRIYKTGTPHQYGCPGAPQRIYCTNQYKRQLREERFVLLGQMITDKPLSDILYAVAHAKTCLNVAFAVVERGLSRGIHHAGTRAGICLLRRLEQEILRECHRVCCTSCAVPVTRPTAPARIRY